MGKPVNILMVEDSHDDALLLIKTLKNAGIDVSFERVDTKEAMQTALDNKVWDIVISDYNMPNFDGLGALKLLQEKGIDLPFILVSGKIGEETAVEAMKAGAQDYIMKNNPSRLSFAVEREIQEAKIRRERKQTEENMIASEIRLREIIDNAPFGAHMYELHSDGRLVFTGSNPSADRILGIENKQFINKTIEEAFPQLTRTEIPAAYRNVAKNGIRFETESIEYKKREIIGAFEISAFQTGQDRMAVFFRDISERKKFETQIKASLEEKKVLLREIHHRVKNNMQIVSSLLSLQFNNIEDNKYKEIFLQSQNRIQSMALIHEKLYQSTNIAQINLKEYIDDLVLNISHSYGIKSNINFDIIGENILISIDNAVPCGIIINEIITNSIKYAFPQGRPGKIQISAESNENNMIHLSISDDGIGIPKEIDIRNTNTLGLTLIKNLAENQLDGELIINREKGTQFQINFRDSK